MGHLSYCAGLVAMLALSSCTENPDNAGELRRQFHLPDAIDITEVTRTGRSLCNSFGPTISGTARFDKAQFDAYRLSFADGAAWTPATLHHFNDDPVAYSATSEALRWRPIAAGGPNVPGFTKAEFDEQGGEGDLLCYVIKVPRRNLMGVPEGQGYPDISFESCTARKHFETPKSFVVGHLDSKTRVLNMRIRLANLPQYCARARTEANTDLPF